jgi:hypothetical protein
MSGSTTPCGVVPSRGAMPRGGNGRARRIMFGLKPRPAWKQRRMGGATGAIAARNSATAARLPMRRQPSRHRPLKRA